MAEGLYGCWRDLGVLGRERSHLPRLCKPCVPGSELWAEHMPSLPILLEDGGSGAGLELKNAGVSVSTVSPRLPSPMPDFCLARQPFCQRRVPLLPSAGSSQDCDVGGRLRGWHFGSSWSMCAWVWNGKGREKILSQPWKPHP